MTKTIIELDRDICNCENCDLHKINKHKVLGHGIVKDNPVMFLGESPSKEEVIAHEPFVGGAGQLLDEILDEVGIVRRDCYITNCVKCQNKNELKNLTPTPEHQKQCRGHLYNEIDLIKPRLIVALGKTALNNLFIPVTLMQDVVGKCFPTTINMHTYDVLAMYHPQFLKYNSANKELRKEYVEHMKIVKEYIDIEVLV